MDQRGQGRDHVDAVSCRTFAANVRPSDSCARLQPRQLHAEAGDPQVGGAVVADRRSREADQNWRQVVSHGRYVTFQISEVAVPRQMFAETLMLIARLRARALHQHEGR
jgi:hypothetical protein